MHRSGTTMAWNIFKFCTALRGLGSIMILFVLAIIGVTYYSVVFVDYGPSLFSGGLLHTVSALAILLLFHALVSFPQPFTPLFLLVMLLWCYFSVVLTDPGHVPPNWRPSIDEERGEVDPLVVSDAQYCPIPPDSRAQQVRFCRKCNQMKPPRCHHCSVCGRCILKMDHHCVWVVNCVGALNYKYFLLFLTSFVSLSLLPNFVVLFTDGEISGTPGALVATFITFGKRHCLHYISVLNLAFALSILGFLLMHMWLLLANTTTIEAYEKATPKWLYDLGRKKNFEQVFGKDKKYWFLPAYSAEDLQMMPELQGLNYPVNPNLDSPRFS
ncbi:Palmitoyltransferase, DHHC domain [Dillenia turbinata]|uniref:S-acyltransferase n=1 Tax=Dillenia turbinata TaxID=194707 RepID=A0AAN8WK68_9MAGN